MPIYDNDGTTNYQIGKVYDNDGATNYQIGKVYDNDGTTNSLIYTAEENVLQYGVMNNWGGYTDNGSYSCDGNILQLVATSSYGNYVGVFNVITCQPFNLTGMESITFDVSTTASTSRQSETEIYVGVVTTVPSSGEWCSTGWQWAGDNAMRFINAKGVPIKEKSNIAGSYTIDVSNLSGNYYVTFCIVCNNGYNVSTNATLSNIKLS